MAEIRLTRVTTYIKLELVPRSAVGDNDHDEPGRNYR